MVPERCTSRLTGQAAEIPFKSEAEEKTEKRKVECQATEGKKAQKRL